MQLESSHRPSKNSFPWHWLAILALLGWNAYQQYDIVNLRDSNSPSSPQGIASRVSALEVVTTETTESLQVLVNSEPVFAFLDVNGFDNSRVYLRNSSITTTLPPTAFDVVQLINNVSIDNILNQTMYEFEGQDPNPTFQTAKFYISTNFTLLCGYYFNYPDGDSNQQPWCMALSAPSCGFLNMFIANFHHIRNNNDIRLSVLMGLSYAACDLLPA